MIRKDVESLTITNGGNDARHDEKQGPKQDKDAGHQPKQRRFYKIIKSGEKDPNADFLIPEEPDKEKTGAQGYRASYQDRHQIEQKTF